MTTTARRPGENGGRLPPPPSTGGGGGSAAVGPEGPAAAASGPGRSEPDRRSEEEEAEEEEEDELGLSALVPRYLADFVQHYHGDFYATRCFDPRLVAQLMAEGFLPIATRRYLLPKLHEERCVLRLAVRGGGGGGGGAAMGTAAAATAPAAGAGPRSERHVPRSVRKKARRFAMTLNRDFDGVVAGCHAQHGVNWLYPHVVRAFHYIHTGGGGGGGGGSATNGGGGTGNGVDAVLFDETGAGPPRPVGSCPVRLYSVEVYDAADGALVAGELGYTVGSVYTSLTGFSSLDSAGSVQLAALGTLLERAGFTLWDLGMYMEYKERMGARPMGRTAFVRAVRRARVETPNVRLVCPPGEGGRANCRDIMDGAVPAAGGHAGGDTAGEGGGIREGGCGTEQGGTEQGAQRRSGRSESPPKRRKRINGGAPGCCELV